MALLALLALATVIRIPSLWEPIGSDQAIGAVIGEALRRGWVLYRDVWDQHTPLVYYIHAAGQVLFGRTTRTVYLIDLLWTLANALALYGLGRRWQGRQVALLATGLYVLFGNSVAFNQDTVGTWTMRVKAEGLMTLPLALGFHAVLRAMEDPLSLWERAGVRVRRSSLWWGLTGLVLGFAVALKPVAGLFLLLVWPVLLAATGRRSGNRLTMVTWHSLWLGGGFLLAQLVYLIPTAVQGTLRDFWRAVVLYNLGPYSEIGLSRVRFLEVSILIGKETFSLWLLAVAGLLWMLWRERRLGNWLIVGWGLARGLILVMQNKFFSYQYLPLLPPLSLLAAYGTVHLWRWAGRWRIRGLPLPLGEGRGEGAPAWAWRVFLMFLLLASVAQFVRTNGLYYSRFLRFASGSMDSETFYAAFNTYPRHYSYPADKAVADWVREHTRPDEPLGTLGGYGATPLWLAERPPAARYVFTYPLFRQQVADDPLIQEMRAELLADLQASRPPYIVLFCPLEEFEPFGPLHAWLTANYELEREFMHGRILYSRRAGDQ